MGKIFHFCQDEKFINSGFNQFEAIYPDCNKLLIYNCLSNELKHIHINEEKRQFIELKPEIFQNIPDKSIVILHSIPDSILEYLSFLPGSVTVMGIIFGYEIYEDPYLFSESKLYDTLTKREYENKMSLKTKIKEFVKSLIFPLIRKFYKKAYITRNEIKRNVKRVKIEKLKRIDYFPIAYWEEYQNETKILGFQKQKQFIEFCYYPLEKILDITTPLNMEKDVLLIGHSGFPNGNHLDIIQKIKKNIPKDIKVTLPLSYGRKDYIESLKQVIKTELPKAEFLENFMNLDEYNFLLNKTKIAIFNNHRQQAMGNIISLLYFGAKVYVSKYNSMYRFFKNNKMIIFSYEKDLKKEQFSEGLSVAEIEHNRKILSQIFSEERLLSSLSNSLKKIKQSKNK